MKEREADRDARWAGPNAQARHTIQRTTDADHELPGAGRGTVGLRQEPRAALSVLEPRNRSCGDTKRPHAELRNGVEDGTLPDGTESGVTGNHDASQVPCAAPNHARASSLPALGMPGRAEEPGFCRSSRKNPHCATVVMNGSRNRGHSVPLAAGGVRWYCSPPARRCADTRLTMHVWRGFHVPPL